MGIMTLIIMTTTMVMVTTIIQSLPIIPDMMLPDTIQPIILLPITPIQIMPQPITMVAPVALLIIMIIRATTRFTVPTSKALGTAKAADGPIRARTFTINKAGLLPTPMRLPTMAT
jgi:hypothetical protein